MEQLRDKIKAEIMEIKYARDDKHKWISSGSITGLIVEPEVVAALQMEGLANWTSWTPAGFQNPEQFVEKLKEFVVKRAPRLFALLVHEKHVELLDHFYGNNFDDDMFPIELLGGTHKERDSDDQTQIFWTWTIESTKNHKRISYRGKGVDDNAIDSMCTRQWLFFVPVFGEDDDNPIDVFDQACQMPFIKELETGGTDEAIQTNFSVVRHFVVDRSHLNFTNNEELVRNCFL
jgi:hypothetical protein